MKNIVILLLLLCGLARGGQMYYAVCDNYEDSIRLSQKIDAANGYPRSGVNVGTGIHVNSQLGVTTKYAGILKCEDGSYLVGLNEKDLNLIDSEFKIYDSVPKITIDTKRLISAGFTTLDQANTSIQAMEITKP